MNIPQNVLDYKKSYVHKDSSRNYWKIVLEYGSSTEETTKRTHNGFEPFEEVILYHTWSYYIYEW